MFNVFHTQMNINSVIILHHHSHVLHITLLFILVLHIINSNTKTKQNKKMAMKWKLLIKHLISSLESPLHWITQDGNEQSYHCFSFKWNTAILRAYMIIWLMGISHEHRNTHTPQQPLMSIIQVLIIIQVFFNQSFLPSKRMWSASHS